MRYIYVSKLGGKPLNIGINAAKRRAHRLDRQDRAKVVEVLGSGLPMQAKHHQELVRARHGSGTYLARSGSSNSGEAKP